MADWSLLDDRLARNEQAAGRQFTVEIDDELSVVCVAPLDASELERIRIRNRKSKTPDVRTARALVAQYTEQIILAGDALEDDDGELATFRSPSLQKRLGVADAATAVFRLFGTDAATSTVVERLTEEAGLGDKDFTEG